MEFKLEIQKMEFIDWQFKESYTTEEICYCFVLFGSI